MEIWKKLNNEVQQMQLIHHRIAALETTQIERTQNLF